MQVLMRLVALVQIIGSAVAAVLAATTRTDWVSTGLVEALAAAGLAGGVALWRAEARGFRISSWVQGLQLLRLQSTTLTYLIGTGPQLIVGVLDGRLALTTGFGAGAYLSLGSPTPRVHAGVNLVAFACLLILLIARPGAQHRSSARSDMPTPAG